MEAPACLEVFAGGSDQGLIELPSMYIVETIAAATPASLLQCSAGLCIVLSSERQCSAVLCNAVQCGAVQYSAVQCYSPLMGDQLHPLAIAPALS